MLKPRVIPILLLQDNGLVKTTKFKNPKYIGDPINVIRIFNTLVSHPSSELLTDPLSDKYYIKSVKTGIFVTISIRANEISIINHVYGYNVKISNRTMRGMQNTALMEIEKRRSKLEKEYQSNIQHSLNHIAKTVKERL